MSCRRCVLRITLRHAGYRRRTKPDQGGSGVRRVALEVAVQHACRQGKRHRVVGLREMIQTNPDITRRTDPLRSSLELREAL